jgi:hypothetical protein
MFSGVTAGQIGLARAHEDVTLEIAPSAPGRGDGGSATLFHVNPDGEAGIEWRNIQPLGKWG